MGDWRLVSNNEAPTYSDAKWAVDNNVFYLNAGQSNEDSNKTITKSQALTKYSISSYNQYIKNKSNNQIVVKRDFTPTVPTKFDIPVNIIYAYPAGSVLNGNVLFASGRLGNQPFGFNFYGGKNYKSLVMLGSDNLPNRNYQNEGDGFNGPVYCITPLPDGSLAVGGYFSSYTNKGVSTSANNYIRLNDNLSVHSSFQAGSGTNGAVGSIVVLDVFSLSLFNIGLAGEFGNYTYSGTTTPSTYSIKIGSNGSVISAPTNMFSVSGLFSRCSIKLDNGMVIIGGESNALLINGSWIYGYYGAVPLYGSEMKFIQGYPLCAFLIDSNTGGKVNVMKRLSSGNIAVGGDFYQILTPSSGTISRYNFAVLSNNMQSVISTNILFNGVVHDIEQQSNGQILVSGDFTQATYNGTIYNCFNVARLNSDLSLDTSFVLGAGFITGSAPKVYAVASRTELFSNNQIIIGGSFSSVKRADGNFAPSSNAAKLSYSGVYDDTW